MQRDHGQDCVHLARDNGRDIHGVVPAIGIVALDHDAAGVAGDDVAECIVQRAGPDSHAIVGYLVGTEGTAVASSRAALRTRTRRALLSQLAANGDFAEPVESWRASVIWNASHTQRPATFRPNRAKYSLMVQMALLFR